MYFKGQHKYGERFNTANDPICAECKIQNNKTHFGQVVILSFLQWLSFDEQKRTVTKTLFHMHRLQDILDTIYYYQMHLIPSTNNEISSKSLKPCEYKNNNSCFLRPTKAN